MEKQNLRGSVSFMAFLMFILLALWCLNIFKHINSGNWTKGQKIVDIAGLLMLLAAFVGMIIPMLKK